MMQVVLLILKIIGIIFLVILGILFVLVLLMLFVPFRYKVKGEWHREAKAQAKIYWLLHILSFRVDYDKKSGLLMKLRVFGIPLWRLREEEPVKDTVKGVQHLEDDVEDTLYRELEKDEQRYREAVKKKSGTTCPEHSSQNGYDSLGSTFSEKYRDSTQKNGDKSEAEPNVRDLENEPKESLFKKIIACIRKRLEKFRFSFEKIYDKVKGMNTFVQDKRKFFENEKNQASLRFLWRQASRLLAHLCPVKGRGTVIFGFEDPYTTGQVLQAASLIYPFCHRRLSIHPVFDEKILEGEGNLQGRIRLVFLLWLTIQIYFDKHTWKLVRSFIK